MAALGKEEKAAMEYVVNNLMGDVSVHGRQWECKLVVEELRCEESINDFLAYTDEELEQVDIPDYPRRWKVGEEPPKIRKKPVLATQAKIVRIAWYLRMTLHDLGRKELTAAEWEKECTIQGYQHFAVNEYKSIDKDSVLGISNPTKVTSSVGSSSVGPSKPVGGTKFSPALEFRKAVKVDKSQ